MGYPRGDDLLKRHSEPLQAGLFSIGLVAGMDCNLGIER